MLRQAEVGRLGAVTMNSHFRQRTRIQLETGVKVTKIDLYTAKSEHFMNSLELSKLIEAD